MALVSVIEAAQHLGVSTHTIKRRLKRGELGGHRQSTPQGFIWVVEIADEPGESNSATVTDPSATASATSQENHLEEMVELLKHDIEERDSQISFLKEELEARRREVQELHVLLQQTQAALPAPGRSWWRRLRGR